MIEPSSFLEKSYQFGFLEVSPSPNMPKVDSSKFWAFLHYEGHDEKPGKATHKMLGGYNPPSGTGGGKNPPAVSGVSWDTNLASNWGTVKNLNPIPELKKPDVSYAFDIGIIGSQGLQPHNFVPGVSPYDTTYQMYMFPNITTWKKPATPLLHTKGQCGAEGVPFVRGLVRHLGLQQRRLGDETALSRCQDAVVHSGGSVAVLRPRGEQDVLLRRQLEHRAVQL